MEKQYKSSDFWLYYSEIGNHIVQLIQKGEVLIKFSVQRIIKLRILQNQSTLLLSAKLIDPNCQIHKTHQMQNLFFGDQMKNIIFSKQKDFLKMHYPNETLKLNLTCKLTEKYHSLTQPVWSLQNNKHLYVCLEMRRTYQQQQCSMKSDVHNFVQFLRNLLKDSTVFKGVYNTTSFLARKNIYSSKKNLKHQIKNILSQQSATDNTNEFIKQKKIIQKRQNCENQQPFKSQNLRPSSGVFKLVSQIIQDQTQNGQNIVQKRGGYFCIKKKTCKIVYLCQENLLNNNNIESEVKQLAVKTLKKTKKKNTIFNYQEKIKKQNQLLQKLTILSFQELKYFAIYYRTQDLNTNQDSHYALCSTPIYPEINFDAQINQLEVSFSTAQDQNSIITEKTTYMDYYNLNLQDFISQRGGSFTILEIIDLIKQASTSIACLHKCGIIHRDVKPANFMVSQQNGQIQLKLIDFGQSTHKSCLFNPNQRLALGFTIPYAPIQCTVNCPQGLNNFQIDLWNLGIMFLQIILKRMPVTYSKCFAGDISIGWPKDFNLFLNRFTCGGLFIYEKYLIILVSLLLKVKPQQRLPLEKFIKAVQMVQEQFKKQF